LAKEVGGSGSTVNAVHIDEDAKEAIEAAAWPLTFFLLPDSAYISGQELTVRTPRHARRPPISPGGQLLAGQTVLVTGASRGKESRGKGRK
jgi:NAD(P)-dependent dehydrogenase (short-subunit alcohol dehydrogenase family)